MKDTQNLEAEVLALVRESIDGGQVVPASWLTSAVIKSHPSISGSDADWYLLCARHHVATMVRRVLGRFKPSEQPDGQLVFPGMKRLQRAYQCERDGSPCVVPTPICTDEELLARAEELDAMAIGCNEHADEIRRYVQRRQRAAAS